MDLLLSILVLITSILLILIVLVQNSKGGGLTSNFSGSNQIMGVRKTTDVLEKTTWIFAVAILVFSISAAMIPRSNTTATKSALDGAATEVAAPAPTTTDDVAPVTATEEAETTEENAE